MKKIIAIAAAISMFAACGAAFAAQNSPSNPTPGPTSGAVVTLAPGNHGGGSTNGSNQYKSYESRTDATTAPEATTGTDATAAPDATVAPEATTSTSVDTTTPTDAPITIVPSATDAPTTVIPSTQGGVSEIPNGLDNAANVSTGITGASTVTGDDAGNVVTTIAGGKDYVEYSTYDVWASDDVLNQLASGSKVSMTLDAGLYPTDHFIAVVNYGDGWVQVPAGDVIVNGDGTVTVLLDNAGVVSFWVPGSDFEEVVYEAPAGATNCGKVVTPVSVVAAADSNDTPSKDADYTVEKSKDYTQVSPQTGYAEAWVVEASTPAGL